MEAGLASSPLDDQINLEEPYLSIRWRSVPQILFAEWKGFATSAAFRAALLKGVHAIREHHVVGYVSDARNARVFVAEDLRWVSEDVAKAIDNHGLSMRKFNSVAAATVWAQSGLGG